uniref:Uncharacterized protein n=1 Tax=Acrobeloides nanus TaxID=290746 RepID=A0A914DHX4_9BILA
MSRRNANKALEALAKMSNVYKAVRPQNMDTKNMKVDLEELEVEFGELDLKIIKAAKEDFDHYANKALAELTQYHLYEMTKSAHWTIRTRQTFT